ncbi:MAG TPA: ATP-binding protein [Anaerolineales bacterium]|nr:ATP-binding protein [Anaerolineales bacterium]
MTGIFWLDWAVLAVSLTNTILLVWLGTIVLLNVERRTWGGWLAAAGLLLGGVFFISHTAILGYGLNVQAIGLNFWWVIGLTAVMVLPFLWYIMMLWYSGFWQRDPSGAPNRLLERHRVWFLLACVLILVLLGFAVATRPTATHLTYPSRRLLDSIYFRGLPVLIIFYPAYVIFCIMLSLDAVRRPGPSHRAVDELARKQARPWLISASLALLMVSVSVGAVFYWLSRFIPTLDQLNAKMVTLGYFDLLIESLIALAVILLGQAVVAYEVFTGQILPRQGFLRQWQRAVLLAIGYGTVIGFTYSTNLRPIYGILLSALLITLFFALFSWRTYSERQRTIESLRPFVASQRFYDQLLSPSSSPDETSLQVPFTAICRDVLNTREAYLIALGPLAPLVGPPLSYPPNKPLDTANLNTLTTAITPDQQIIRAAGQLPEPVAWVVPLWSQRGLAGVLLLAEKQDGGIYAQEEIEVAQASGERLIDTKASLEIGQRLMDLQRKRMAESQVMDQRARRILHDDVLQQLHTAMLTLVSQGSESTRQTEDALEMLTEVHTQISNLLRAMPAASIPEIKANGLIGALRKVVEEELAPAFDSIEWQTTPEGELLADALSPLESEVIFYAAREGIRNAARHGRPQPDSNAPTGPLSLQISIIQQDGLLLIVQDDGIGIQAETPRSENGGQGLALHTTMMAVIGGTMEIDSSPGEYTRVRLHLPAH